MKRKLLTLCLSVFIFSAVHANTPNLQIVGQIPVTISLKNSSDKLSADSAATKTIMLQAIILSPAAKNYLANYASRKKTSTLESATDSLPSQVQLGMGNVPVLDQGSHGTCATFANTGVIDAALQRGDYVSQLCNLELGNYIKSKEPTYLSGWSGSFGSLVLSQIQQYGVISKAFQRSNGCAGIYHYPLLESNNEGKAMSTDDFTKVSESIIPSSLQWKIILYAYDAFTNRDNRDQDFSGVKSALANGHRVTFGVILDLNVPNAGLINYKATNDAWALTPAMVKDFYTSNNFGGHELIITGFDDNAEIKMPDGSLQKGVFTLRNSWSDKAGDHGDYYMTYDYFKQFVMEAQEIDSSSDAKP